MRISGWSSDVCSSDLVRTVIIDEAHMVEQDEARLTGLGDGTSRAFRLEQSKTQSNLISPAKITILKRLSLPAKGGTSLTKLPKIGRESCKERVGKYG